MQGPRCLPIDYEKLINWEIPEVKQNLTKRDTMLYALGVGLGADPCYLDTNHGIFTVHCFTSAFPTFRMIPIQGTKL